MEARRPRYLAYALILANFLLLSPIIVEDDEISEISLAIDSSLETSLVMVHFSTPFPHGMQSESCKINPLRQSVHAPVESGQELQPPKTLSSELKAYSQYVQR